MSDDSPSAVSEALPAGQLYVIPEHVEYRPHLRKKMLRRGPRALTVTELLAVIIGPAGKHKAEALARRHGLQGLVNVTIADLRNGGALGDVAAMRVAAAIELHRRLSAQENQTRPKLTKPREVYDQVKDIAGLRKEHLVGLYLDAQNGLVHRETLSVGSLNTTRTHPREILYPAIEHAALGFLLTHNHPSGCVEPSPEDVEFTRSVKRAGEIMGIELYDHVIVSVSGHASMRELGML